MPSSFYINFISWDQENISLGFSVAGLTLTAVPCVPGVTFSFLAGGGVGMGLHTQQVLGAASVAKINKG